MPRLWCLLGILLLAAWPSTAQDKKKPDPKKLPRVTFTIPLGAIPGKTSKLIIRGSLLDSATEVKILDGKGSAKILAKSKANVPDKNPDQVGDTQIEIELKLNDKLDGSEVSFIISTPTGDTKPHSILTEMLPLIQEKEGNDGFQSAQSIQLPVVIEGTIQRPKDVDVFRFEGKKGQKLYTEVLASRYGAPLDSILTLYNARFQELASNDDFTAEHRDAKIEAILPQDGIYFLGLIDAHDSGGSLHVYRLIVK